MKIFDNDYERFACDIIQVVLDSGNYKPTEALIKRVGKMLETGPMITTWPTDLAAAAQRARDRAVAAATRRPELPRLTPPGVIAPPLKLPVLPRPQPLPLVRPGLLRLPELPR